MTGLMVSMLTFVSGIKTRLSGEEKGATAVEYGLLVALIAAFVIGVVTVLGGEIKGAFNDIVAGMGGTRVP
ncbi:Flp family type IVb pilin [Micrococcaceae bacterium Sec7.4]